MTRVAIIGGGIGGLTAARALSLRGIEVSVYEAAAELKEIGAGVGLGPNAMKVLRSLGLEDDVRAIQGNYVAQVTGDGKTGRLISATTKRQEAELYGIEGATAHRADLLSVLARSLPEDTVRLGARCTSVDPGGPVAMARFADGSEIEADAIIGADGIHSVIRTSLFGPDAPRFTGKICYRSVVPMDAISGGRPPHDGGQWLGPLGTIVMYPLRGDELMNIVCHHDDEEYLHETWVTECERAEVLERYAAWHESLLRVFRAGDVWYKWALYDRDPLPRWTQGRVSLLGDAAHPMLPYLGQGAGQAIEDGCVLAAALDDAPAGSAAALALYERVRRPRTSRVVLTARARGTTNHLTSPLAAWKRDVSIAARRRMRRRDPEGRGADWIPGYDASSPDVLRV